MKSVTKSRPEFITHNRDGPEAEASCELRAGAEASHEHPLCEYTSSRTWCNGFDPNDTADSSYVFRLEISYPKFHGDCDKYCSFREKLIYFVSYHQFADTYARESPVFMSPSDWAKLAYQEVSHMELRQAEHAWFYPLGMIRHEPAKQMVQRAGLPSLGLKALDDWYALHTSARETKLLQKFSDFELVEGGDPMESLMELVNISAQIMSTEVHDCFCDHFLAASDMDEI